jgi:hypothetical protein
MIEVGMLKLEKKKFEESIKVVFNILKMRHAKTGRKGFLLWKRRCLFRSLSFSYLRILSG